MLNRGCTGLSCISFWVRTCSLHAKVEFFFDYFELKFLFFMPAYSPSNFFAKAESQIDDLYLIIYWINAKFHGISRVAGVGNSEAKAYMFYSRSLFLPLNEQVNNSLWQGSGSFLAQRAIKVPYVKIYFLESHTIFFNSITWSFIRNLVQVLVLKVLNFWQNFISETFLKLSN